jgi:hypothetical protein
MKNTTFCWTWLFSQKRKQISPQISLEERNASCLANNAKTVELRWINCQLGVTGISRLFGDWCSVHRPIQHRRTSTLVSFDRYTIHLVACGVWR